MTVEEFRRLLFAPEIIVLDVADAALRALERALILEHPLVLSLIHIYPAEEPKIGGRAARSKGVMFAIGLGEGEANDTSVESQGELESGGVAQDSPGAPPYAGLIVGRRCV